VNSVLEGQHAGTRGSALTVVRKVSHAAGSGGRQIDEPSRELRSVWTALQHNFGAGLHVTVPTTHPAGIKGLSVQQSP